jgi:hypothetical protein
MRHFFEDAFVAPADAVARVRAWRQSGEGFASTLASSPPGATLADALREHRRLRQLGRCMVEPGANP